MRMSSFWAGLTVLALCLLLSLPAAAGDRPAAPKNVIVLISDGCGYYHIDATNCYQYGALDTQVYESWPVDIGMTTYSASGNGYSKDDVWSNFDYVKSWYTDSASAGTAMSTGIKTYDAAIGVDMAGQPLEHIADRLKDQGKSTGVVSSVQISHATPAAFVAHNVSRNNYSEIAREMLLDSRTDVIMGCGHPWFDANGQPKQSPNTFNYVGGEHVWNHLMNGDIDFDVNGDGIIDNTVEDCNGDGIPDPWHFVQTKADFQAMATGATPVRVLGVPECYKTLQHDRGGDYYADPFIVPLNANTATLEEMTKAALNVLDNNPLGFFVMVEGGAVDWAGHGNSIGRMIEEEIDFNRTVEAVVAWVEANSNWDETVVVVTGDHETGYLTGPGSGGNPPVWNPVVNNGAGAVPGVEWHSGNHTNSVIPFFAKGEAAAGLQSYLDCYDPTYGPLLNNTEMAQWMFDMYPAEFVPVPENIIVLISDGCGYDHITATNYYQYGAAGTQPYESWPLVCGMSTFSYDGSGYAPITAWDDFAYVMSNYTDSASAGTAMSTGVKTYDSAIGVDKDGNPLVHLAEYAEQMAKATGVVSSVQFSHATPAAHVAHNVSRNNYAEIAREMILDSRIDVIMGCGHPWYDADGNLLQSPNTFNYVGGEAVWNGLVNQQVDFDLDGDGIIDNSVEDAGSHGNYDAIKDPWTLVQTREEFQNLMTGEVPKRVIGVPQCYKTLQHDRGGDYYADPYVVPLNENVPTLAEMTSGALNVLGDNPNGFFLMVEGGAVDWASHGNATGRMIEEQIDFNHAVEAVIDWVEQNSDWSRTLVVVTADHECGYLTGPGSGGNPPVWNPIVNNGAGVLPGTQWNSGSHTNSLVPFFAKGDAIPFLAAHVDEWDEVRGPFLTNTELAQACSFLWPGRDSDAAADVEEMFAGEQLAQPAGYPNPFRAATTIRYSVPQAGPVSLDVYDVTGRRVETLFQGHQGAGDHAATWSADGMSAGIYFARLQVGHEVSVRKLTLSR